MTDNHACQELPREELLAGEITAMAVDCLAGYLCTCKLEGDGVPAPPALTAVDPAAVARELDPDAPACESFVNMVTVDADACAKAHFV